MQTKTENIGIGILTNSGWKTFLPRQTKIVEYHDCGDLTVIREDYMGYSGSNVYAIDEHLAIVWEAELPHNTDTFANILVDKESFFTTSTWNGIKCSINKRDGRTTIIGISK